MNEEKDGALNVKSRFTIPRGKAPWNPSLLKGFAFLFSFGASGILAALNWKRLGKPEKTLPTLLISISGLTGFIFLLGFIPLPEFPARILGYGINIGIGRLFASIQEEDYALWKEKHGEEAALSPGFAAPLLIAISFLGLGFFLIFAPEYQPLTEDKSILYYNKGVKYQEKGRLSSALSNYNLAIEKNPQFVDAYINRALVYMDLENMQGAYRDISMATKLAPKEGNNYYLRGLLLLNSGELSRAKEDLEKALNLGVKSKTKKEIIEILQIISEE